MKLRSKLLVFVAALLCVTAICCIIVANLSFRRTIIRSTSADMVQRGDVLAADLAREPSQQQAFDMLGASAQLLGVRVTIVATNGKVMFDSQAPLEEMDNHRWREEIKMAISEGVGESIRKSDTVGVDMLYHAQAVQAPALGGMVILRLGAPLQSVNMGVSQFSVMVTPILLILFIIAIGLSLLFIRLITKPIEYLATTASAYARGDLTGRSIINEPQELKILSDALNTMAEELAHQMQILKSDKRLYASLLASMNEGVILINADNTILLGNRAANAILHLPTDLAQKRLSSVFADNNLLAAVETVRTEATSQQLTVIRHGRIFGKGAAYAAHGEETVLQVSIALVEGISKEVVLTFSDVTAVKRLEQVRTDFVANVSHELKTPLTAIRGFSETLAEGEADTETMSKFAQIINRNARQMDGIIDDLLLLSTLENSPTSMSRSLYPVSTIIAESLENVAYKAQQKEITITADDQTDDAKVWVNQGLIIQALTNILVNAVIYSTPGSTIQLRARFDGTKVSLSVEDHGCGIATGDISRIFERFYRVDKARSRSQGGTGLGLSIVKHIMSLHGGTVSVNSTLGVGSTFTITVPREEKIIEDMRAKSNILFPNHQKF